jgi:ribose/xylose/arabinose/galactoside ABC-type transport system permease subunit
MKSSNRGLAEPTANFLWNQMPLVALIVLGAIATLLSDRFLSPINLNNILMQGAVMTVIAIGMTYVIICGGFDLSVGSVVALSGVIAAAVMLEYGIAAGIVAGIAVGALVGWVNGFVVTRMDVNPFIATLGTMVLFRGVTFLITDGQPVVGEDGLPDLFIDFATERLFGVPYLVWFPIALVLVFSWVLHRTSYGIRIFATGGNTEAAYLAGVAVARVRASTYIWCGALAGVGGVMLASRLQSGQPTSGSFYELTAIAAVVLGGASLFGGEGKLYKSIIGVFIMVVLANALNLANVPSYWQQVAVGAVIIAAAAADRVRHR